MSKEMTLEEEMHAMMSGKYTSEVMDDDDMAVYDEENSEGYVHRDEDDDYDEVDEAEAKLSGSDEIEDEIAGTDKVEAEVDKTAVDDGSDAGKDEINGKADDGVDTGDNTGDAEVKADTDLEDTDSETKTDGDSDTKDLNVGSDTDTQEPQDGDKKEDTQLDEVDDKDKEAQKDEAETKDGESDYKQKYEEALARLETADAFREKVTADFKANGKMVKGITDPEKIVKNLQMSTGMTRKLDGYKSIKPLVKPLEDRGLLQDTAKFDMLMKLADGDKEALKHYMVENNIDPIDIDTEDVNYDNSSTVTSPEELMFGEMMDTANEYGVGSKFSDTVLSEWDDDSASKLFDGQNGASMSRKLAEQMSNGIYDDVMAIARNMDMTETGFRGKNSLEKYEIASGIYNQHRQNELEAQESVKADEVATTELANKKAEDDRAALAETERVKNVQVETDRLAKVEADRKYAEKVAEKERVANEARDRATGVSQNRATSTTVTSDSEPQSQNDFRAEWRKLMGK